MGTRTWLAPLLLLFSVVAAIGAMPVSTSAQGSSLGFYPSELEIDNGLRGQRFEVSVFIVNNDDELRIFTLEPIGEIADWISYAHPAEPDTAIDVIEVDAGSEQQILVHISIPADAANGTYTGTNRLDGYDPEAFETREGIVLGFQQRIALDVSGDQVLDLRAGAVQVSDVEVGQPLALRANLTNLSNVAVRPHIDVAFRSHGEERRPVAIEAARIQVDTEPLKVGERKTVEAPWDTTGQAPGLYTAACTISVQGEEIDRGAIDFNIVPFGSLRRDGAITAIEFVEPPQPGTVAHANVIFQNGGEIESRASFIGQLYRDGVAIAQATSPGEVLARPGAEVSIDAFIDIPPDASGDYELRGRVHFEGAETDEFVKAFTVGGGKIAPVVPGRRRGGRAACRAQPWCWSWPFGAGAAVGSVAATAPPRPCPGARSHRPAIPARFLPGRRPGSTSR
ncbi:MAG: hypothetical protein U5Q44_02935 [Dehalococcoidia bacterium]|nr:hypothetical protein [Dehalococcoidia bacterium]